jgi:hypothetical protein
MIYFVRHSNSVHSITLGNTKTLYFLSANEAFIKARLEAECNSVASKTRMHITPAMISPGSLILGDSDEMACAGYLSCNSPNISSGAVYYRFCSHSSLLPD